ncbi:MAG TPA: hypothetical protein DER09_02665 [Prolixibacteraceae bacterium]|nr:hypothetical protein [Prolixibacteraceae bacterium]
MAFVAYFAVSAQDKIITIQHDTIECRIISVSADRISYEKEMSDNQIAGKSIATTEVLQYFRSAQNKNRIFSDLRNPVLNKPAYRWMFSLQGGLSNCFNDYEEFKSLLTNNGNSESNVDDYIQNLNSGYFVNPGFHYLLTNFLGIGVEYSFFHSESDGEFIIKIPDNSGYNLPIYHTFLLNEKLYVHFAGASVLVIQNLGKNKKISLMERISPGMFFYRNESRNKDYQVFWGNSNYYEGQVPYYLDYANAASTGKSFGFKGGLSLNYSFTPRLTAGFTGNIVLSKLNQISIDGYRLNLENQKLENPLDISRFDYGISIFYNL